MRGGEEGIGLGLRLVPLACGIGRHLGIGIRADWRLADGCAGIAFLRRQGKRMRSAASRRRLTER